MQIDADPQEDQQNASESNYIVENPTLVLTDFNECTLNHLLHTKVYGSSQGWGQCVLEMAGV